MSGSTSGNRGIAPIGPTQPVKTRDAVSIGGTIPLGQSDGASPYIGDPNSSLTLGLGAQLGGPSLMGMGYGYPAGFVNPYGPQISGIPGGFGGNTAGYYPGGAPGLGAAFPAGVMLPSSNGTSFGANANFSIGGVNLGVGFQSGQPQVGLSFGPSYAQGVGIPGQQGAMTASQLLQVGSAYLNQEMQIDQNWLMNYLAQSNAASAATASSVNPFGGMLGYGGIGAPGSMYGIGYPGNGVNNALINSGTGLASQLIKAGQQSGQSAPNGQASQGGLTYDKNTGAWVDQNGNYYDANGYPLTVDGNGWLRNFDGSLYYDSTGVPAMAPPTPDAGIDWEKLGQGNTPTPAPVADAGPVDETDTTAIADTLGSLGSIGSMGL